MTETAQGYRSPHRDMLEKAGYFDGIEPEAIPHRDYLFFKLTQPLRLVGGVDAVQLNNGIWQLAGWFMNRNSQKRHGLSFEFDPDELEDDHARNESVSNLMDIIELHGEAWSKPDSEGSDD